MAVREVSTRSEFKEQVLDSKKVVLVDFWAPWCPPCRMMAPHLETVARKMEKTVEVVKIDIESSEDAAALANEYEVQGIPNLLIFKDGSPVNQLVGMYPAPALEQELEKHN